MTLMRVFAIAGVALFAPLIARAVQEPPKPAGVSGVVTRVGLGTPLAGARVTITSTGNAEGQGGAGGFPPEMMAQIEALVSQGVDPGPLMQSMSMGGGGRKKPPDAIPYTTTDDQGKFAFANLSPGRYTLEVKANGYVPQGPGKRSPFGPDGVVTLLAGETKTDVAFSLIPAGNVSGRLRDTLRQPVSNVPVQLLRAVYNENGQRTLQPVAKAQTNDRGEYRFFWVTPGRYYLRAGNPAGGNPLAVLMALEGGNGGAMPNPNEGASELGVAYFPGVQDMNGARAVEIGAGEELGGIDWAVPPQPANHTVGGRVIDSRTGKAPASARVMSIPMSDGSGGVGELAFMSLMMGDAGSAKSYDPATGRLELRNLAPGAYQIMAIVEDPPIAGGARGQSPTPPGVFDDPFGGGGGLGTLLGLGGGGVTGTALVTVADADIDEVVVTAGPPAAISGHVSVEGELPARPAPRGGPEGRGGRGNPANAGLGLNVQLIPLRQDALSEITGAIGLRGGAGGQGRAAADGTFQISRGAGEYRIGVVPMPAGAYLKDARMGGVSVMDSPLVLPASGTLEVVVSMHGGEVNGLVVDRRGVAMPSAQAVLVPDRARQRLDLYKTINAGADGRFSIKGVAPGDYRVFSWEDIDAFRWFDPEFIESSLDRGSPIHVSESSTENVEVKMIPAGGAR